VNSEPVVDSQLAGDSEQGGEEDDEEPGQDWMQEDGNLKQLLGGNMMTGSLR